MLFCVCPVAAHEDTPTYTHPYVLLLHARSLVAGPPELVRHFIFPNGCAVINAKVDLRAFSVRAVRALSRDCVRVHGGERHGPRGVRMGKRGYALNRWHSK